MAMSDRTPSSPGTGSLLEDGLQILSCLGLLIAVDPKIPFALLEDDAADARWGVDRVGVLILPPDAALIHPSPPSQVSAAVSALPLRRLAETLGD
jgi:hypothetical protein